MAETIRCEWDKVFKMPAIEFLNLIAYRKDKAEHERQQIERWKKRN